MVLPEGVEPSNPKVLGSKPSAFASFAKEA